MAEDFKTAPPAADLAKRLHGALTAKKDELYDLFSDPSQEVLMNLLKNPALDENHLLILLKRRDLPEELLKSLYRHELMNGSHLLKVALVHNPCTPAQVRLAVIPHLYLFELVTVCYLPGATADQKLAAERAVLQRIPTIPAGNKITVARRGTATIVGELLKMEGGDPRLVEACLSNPRLKESSLYEFLSGAKATAETISLVGRHERWKTRPNIQIAMLKNQKTPAVWFTLFLPRQKTHDLKNLLLSHRFGPLQKREIEEELHRRGL